MRGFVSITSLRLLVRLGPKRLTPVPLVRSGTAWSPSAAAACGRRWSSSPPTWPSPCPSRWASRRARPCPSTTWRPTCCSSRWPTWGRGRASSSTWRRVRLDRPLGLLCYFPLYSALINQHRRASPTPPNAVRRNQNIPFFSFFFLLSVDLTSLILFFFFFLQAATGALSCTQLEVGNRSNLRFSKSDLPLCLGEMTQCD